MVPAPVNGQDNNGVVCPLTAPLLSGIAGNAPDSMPTSSRVTSPIPSGSDSVRYRASAQTSSSPSRSVDGSSLSSNASTVRSRTGNLAAQISQASTTLTPPASSLLLSKAFKCLKPNCNKSYKQANGLKYHMKHGLCNFAVSKDFEHLQELLASKRSEKAKVWGAEEGEVTLSDAELQEAKKEAERKSRPYACGLGLCPKRYTHINGLRKSLF